MTVSGSSGSLISIIGRTRGADTPQTIPGFKNGAMQTLSKIDTEIVGRLGPAYRKWLAIARAELIFF
jgi:hypothetical protein